MSVCLSISRTLFNAVALFPHRTALKQSVSQSAFFIRISLLIHIFKHLQGNLITLNIYVDSANSQPTRGRNFLPIRTLFANLFIYLYTFRHYPTDGWKLPLRNFFYKSEMFCSKHRRFNRS